MGADEQKEEIEVLDSIYDGDPKFRKVGETTFQYQVSQNVQSRYF